MRSSTKAQAPSICPALSDPPIRSGQGSTLQGRSQLESQQISLPQETSQHRTSTMLISLTVGKVDAGVAVLLTQDKRLVRFHRRKMQFPASCAQELLTKLPSPPDRVSLYPTASQYLLRKHRRYHRLAQLRFRAEVPSFIPRAPRHHLLLLWRVRTGSTSSPLQKCYADICSP